MRQEIRKLVICALFEKGEAMFLGRDESLTVVAFRVFFSWRVVYLSGLIRLWTSVHRWSGVVSIFTDMARMST